MITSKSWRGRVRIDPGQTRPDADGLQVPLLPEKTLILPEMVVSGRSSLEILTDFRRSSGTRPDSPHMNLLPPASIPPNIFIRLCLG